MGLFLGDRPDEIPTAARSSAGVTHAHPLGMEGAALVATATAGALRGDPAPEVLAAAAASCEARPFLDRLERAAAWLAPAEAPAPREVARALGNGIAAAESCVTAVYAALRFLREPFPELMDFVVRVRGDVDTIGAMAGAVWGAARGAADLPEEHLGRLEDRERIERLAHALHGRARRG